MPLASPGLIVREREPDNLESPFAALDGPVTPNTSFYVRNHFAVPDVDAESWSLTVDGAVEKPLTLSLKDLQALPAETTRATLECAGNGRVFLVPKKEGAAWQTGGVSTADWTGVALAEVLRQAGVKSNAVDVVFEGHDAGTPEKPAHPKPPVPYTHSIPIARAMSGRPLLAYRMNGEPLPRAHGYPVRLVVPGFYAMASAKWLKRITVTTAKYHGYFESTEYCTWAEQNGVPTRVPLTELNVKSQIARPAFGEAVPAGRPYRVYGAAWTADTTVAKVEVSTDGGKHFAAATLLGDALPNAWQLWEYAWTVPAQPGPATLMTRATDGRGRVQPMERDAALESYAIHHVVAHPVDVV